MKRFPNNTILLATHNPGKIREMELLLKDFPLKIISADQAGAPDVEETGDTFRENARLKAESCLSHTGLTSLSDDSGLVIPALGGIPGIHTGRWAGDDYPKAFATLEKMLGAQGLKTAPAYLLCVLALAMPDSPLHYYEGRVDGHLVFPPREGNSFGYDPIFQPLGYTQTFSEMTPLEKNRISHRGQALEKFLHSLNDH